MSRATVNGPARIVYLMDRFEGPWAGTERQLFELVRGLDRRRFEPSLVLFRTTAFVETPENLPCPASVLGVGSLKTPGSWLRLAQFARTLRRNNVRLVHILFNDAAVVGPLFCRLSKARVVVARRDMGFWYTAGTLRLLRFSNRFVDAMTANSQAVRANVNRCERYPLDRMTVLPNGLDSRRFEAPPEPGLRERLGIGPADPVVGMVANLRAIKRHDDLLRAFRALRDRHPAAHLLLAGHGEREEALRALASTLGLDSSVHFLGRIGDVVPVVRHFDVGVLTSESEGFSNAIIEYHGCGRPVVCTRTGGNTELVEHGRTGFLVEVGDIAGLADRIDRLITDRRLACVMGTRARKRVLETFTVERMVDLHMQLYDRVLARA